jgi:hypothetical protein
MSKRDKDLQNIEIFKERFRHLDSEKIRKRLTSWTLVKEAAIALNEVLKERGEDNAR